MAVGNAMRALPAPAMDPLDFIKAEILNWAESEDGYWGIGNSYIILASMLLPNFQLV